ncbi:MAG TPA: Spy/CpxP family protein refolding chaperone [Burkholderiaceae bacterium]|nr:Spy/CpxP family protein refolding chaperone [Burkholderiaceae bacterium]
MKSVHKHLIAAGLLATLGFSALAQTPPATAPAPQARQERMHRHDPAKMQERMAQRQAELKAKLQITSAQEGAWGTFTSALKPPADRPARPDRAEFAKLTTPERIDRMQAMKVRRDAEMAKRADATKTFYTALSPEQQKVFDAETLRFGQGMHRHHGGPGHRG